MKFEQRVPALLSTAQLFRDLPRVRCHHPGSRQRHLILPRLLIQLVELLILFSSRSPIHRSFIAHPPSVLNSIHSHAPLPFLLFLFTSRALKLIYLYSVNNLVVLADSVGSFLYLRHEKRETRSERREALVFQDDDHVGTRNATVC